MTHPETDAWCGISATYKMWWSCKKLETSLRMSGGLQHFQKARQPYPTAALQFWMPSESKLSWLLFVLAPSLRTLSFISRSGLPVLPLAIEHLTNASLLARGRSKWFPQLTCLLPVKKIVLSPLYKSCDFHLSKKHFIYSLLFSWWSVEDTPNDATHASLSSASYL